jgi:hypothetical protein
MVCFAISCSGLTQSGDNPIKGIKVAYNIPILKLDGELLNVTDSFFVFYFKNFILYRTTYKRTWENLTRIESIEVKFHHFVHERNSDFGFYYDSLKQILPKKIPVDSFLKLKAFKGFNFYDNVNDSLIQKVNLPNGGIVETYLPRVRYDQSYGDTTYLYYTPKLKDVEYSFSKELDTSRNLKVYKVRIVYNSQFYTGYSFKFPRREYLFELGAFEVKDADQIPYLFEQFERYLLAQR